MAGDRSGRRAGLTVAAFLAGAGMAAWWLHEGKPPERSGASEPAHARGGETEPEALPGAPSRDPPPRRSSMMPRSWPDPVDAGQGAKQAGAEDPAPTAPPAAAARASAAPHPPPPVEGPSMVGIAEPSSEPATVVVNDPTVTLEGRVDLTGVRPPPRRVEMRADPWCAKRGKTEIDVARIEGALIYWRDAPPADLPGLPATMRFEGCQIEPPVLGARTHQAVDIFNDDLTLVNVHATGRREEFNFAIATQGQRVRRIFRKPDVFVVRDDVHPWIRAKLYVFDHAYFTYADASGHFRLDDLPARGRYTLVAVAPWIDRPVQMTVTATDSPIVMELRP